jgi:1-acyl-sn-glycerol-3-phosphate acyltransferase
VTTDPARPRRVDAAWNVARPSRAARAFYGTARTVLVGLCYLWFRMSVEGRHHIPTRGAFILAPVHRSNLDTPIVAAVTRRPLRFMGKDSLWASHKVVAWVLSALGGFPVARGTADRDALRRCQAILEAGQPLVLYPEGTRKRGDVVEEVFDGPAFLALRTGVPIIPVGIAGSEAAQGRGATWIRPVKVRVVVGPPIRPARAETGRATSRRAVRALTEELQQAVQTQFDAARRA